MRKVGVAILASVGPNDELWAYVDESYELSEGKLTRQLLREPSDEITEQDLESVLYEIRRTALDRRPGVPLREIDHAKTATMNLTSCRDEGFCGNVA